LSGTFILAPTVRAGVATSPVGGHEPPAPEPERGLTWALEQRVAAFSAPTCERARSPWLDGCEAVECPESLIRCGRCRESAIGVRAPPGNRLGCRSACEDRWGEPSARERERTQPPWVFRPCRGSSDRKMLGACVRCLPT
jgi:hypothetical protein